MSFPQATGQCPIYYNHYNTGRPHESNVRYVSRYQDIPTESYYPLDMDCLIQNLYILA